MASNELALSGVASTSLKEAHTTAGFARGCKLGASVVNQLVGAQPHICGATALLVPAAIIRKNGRRGSPRREQHPRPCVSGAVMIGE
jgi:hypothetical protein